MSNERKLAGVVGFYDQSHALVEGMQKVRDAKWESFDAFTPYPVHGLDDAQGLKRSFLPYITFIAGLTGFISAFALQVWTSVYDWPINVGGKPFYSWPAFVPIFFELTILFAGVTTVLSLFAICGLPNIKKKSIDPSITRDRFALMIENPPEKKKGTGRAFSESDATQFLKNAGAKEVRAVYEEGWF